MIGIKVDVRGLDGVRQSIGRLQSGLRDKAMAAAINKTAAKAQTEVNRGVRDEFLISADEVRNSLSLRRASAKGPGMEAAITIFGSRKRRGRSLNVMHFIEKAVTVAQARRRAKKNMLYGIGRGGRLLPVLGFKFKRGGGVKQIEGAFIGNKGRTVFVRTGDKRLPIKPVQMIGVSQMFSTEKVKRRVMDRINREFSVEIDRAVKMLLEGAR